MRAREYVVVGASGILAPLGQELRSAGIRTVGVSRGARLEVGSWDERVGLDTHDFSATTSFSARWTKRTDLLVAYSPAVGDSCWQPLSAMAVRVLVVATTKWVHVEAGRTPWAPLEPHVFQLGWVQTATGSRWHTPMEISHSLATALAQPWPTNHTTVLGETTPWSARPRS